MTFYFKFLVTFIIGLTTSPLFALDNYTSRGPLGVRSQNPLYLQFIADPMSKAKTIGKNNWAFDLETSYSNVFEDQGDPTRSYELLDMEIWRTALNFKYGITEKTETGIEVPFLSFTSGFLDAFIQNYHNAFGLRNGGREVVDNGDFTYSIVQGGNEIYRVNQEGFGLSDVTLWHKWNFFNETKTIPAFAAKTLLKLPTGKPSQGTGSGSPDFGISLLAQKSYKRFSSYSKLSFFWIGNHDYLDPILRNGSFAFGQAFELNLAKYLSIIAQVDGQTGLFKNLDGNADLEKMILDLSFGLRGEIPFEKGKKKIFYDFAFSEDVLAVGPSVDFSVLFKVGIDSSIFK